VFDKKRKRGKREGKEKVIKKQIYLPLLFLSPPSLPNFIVKPKPISKLIPNRFIKLTFFFNLLPSSFNLSRNKGQKAYIITSNVVFSDWYYIFHSTFNPSTYFVPKYMPASFLPSFNW
jgi:hypothetical protein